MGFGRFFGRSGEALGRSLGGFWCLCGVLESLGGTLDRFLEALGRILGALGSILGGIVDQKSFKNRCIC